MRVVKFKTCGKFLDLIWYAHQFGKVRVLVFWKQIWYVEQKEKTRFICHLRRVLKFYFAWQILNKKWKSEVSLIISGFAVGQPTSRGFPLAACASNRWRLGVYRWFCFWIPNLKFRYPKHFGLQTVLYRASQWQVCASMPLGVGQAPLEILWRDYTIPRILNL